MTVINLTPHEVRVIRKDREDIVFPPSGQVARLGAVELGTQCYRDVDAPVELVQYGGLVQPPPRLAGTWYLVSLPTALGAPRDDFLFPYIEVRDEAGRIVGCRMLARVV